MADVVKTLPGHAELTVGTGLHQLPTGQRLIANFYIQAVATTFIGLAGRFKTDLVHTEPLAGTIKRREAVHAFASFLVTDTVNVFAVLVGNAGDNVYAEEFSRTLLVLHAIGIHSAFDANPFFLEADQVSRTIFRRLTGEGLA